MSETKHILDVLGIVPDSTDTPWSDDQQGWAITQDTDASEIKQDTPALLSTKLNGIEVYIRASQMSKCMAGSFGLSDNQKSQLQGLQDRKDGKKLDSKGKVMTMTPKMNEAYDDLIDKRDNPKLNKGAFTYLDEIITTNTYNIDKFSDSAQTRHGNAMEQTSIDQLNTLTNQSFKKCEDRKTDADLLLTGCCDIYAPELNAVLDMKNPFTVHTLNQKRAFEMTLDESGDVQLDKIQKEYFYQGQAYCELYNVEYFYLVYTLNENYYMQFGEDADKYSDWGVMDRVIVKKLKRDREVIEKYKERIPAIQEAILDLKNIRALSMEQTANHLMELTK